MKTPAEPTGGWRIQLLRRQKGPEIIREEVVPQDGSAILLGDHPIGDYWIRIKTDEGQTWATISLDRERMLAGQAQVIALGSVRAQGVVRLGADAFDAATLLFGGGEEDEAIMIRANRLGVFMAYLPRVGAWRVTATSERPRLRRVVTVTLPEPQDGVSPVEVQVIPEGVEGSVVDENGLSVTSGIVVAQRVADRNREEARIADGSFRIDRLSDGEHYVRARVAPGVESERVLVTVSDGLASPALLALVVQGPASLHARVLAGGMPVAGADVFSFMDVTAGASSPATARTGSDGRFTLAVPKGATSACIGVFPAGGPGDVVRVTVSDDEVDVPIAPRSGTVLLDVPPWNAKTLHGRNVVLIRGNCAIPPFFFRYGHRHHLDDRGDRWLHRIDGMGEGAYVACALTTSELAAFTGAPTADTPCVRGVLTPGANLNLSLLP